MPGSTFQSWNWRRLLPRTLAGRVMAALVLTLVITTGALLAIIDFEARQRVPILQERTNTRIAGALARVVLETPDPGSRDALLELVRREFPYFDGSLTEEEGYQQRSTHLVSMARHFPDGYAITTASPEPLASNLPRQVIIRTPEGVKLKLTIVFGDLRFVSLGPALLSAAVLGFVLVILGWISRSLTRQLSDFAVTARAFGPGILTPFPMAGPHEMQQLAGTFNDMAKRISELMSNQTIALMAVGHDLRTPITRMQMRLSGISDAKVRQQLSRDLEYMDDMTGDVLRVLSGNAAGGEAELADLASILETVRDDFSQQGIDVEYAGPTRATMNARAEDALRIVTNLVSNAVRYGDRVRITLQALEGQMGCRIWVDDDGPGLSSDLHGSAKDLFENASHQDGHFGLGLHIANQLAVSHRGGLTLSRSPMGGLRAEVTLGSL